MEMPARGQAQAAGLSDHVAVLFSYPGNNRLEIRHIDAAIDGEAFDIVVESCAGSAALSLDLHARGTGKRHVVSDTYPHLVGLFRFAAEHGSEPCLRILPRAPQ